MSDPNDLRAFKGPDFKVIDAKGGIGKPKAKSKQSPAFVEAKAEKKARAALKACRTCPNLQGFRLEPHHIVRRGAPHFGGWAKANILALCLECHTKYHAGDELTRKAIRLALTQTEVDYSDNLAYQGFVDAIYWPLPKDPRGQTVAVGLDVAAIGAEVAA